MKNRPVPSLAPTVWPRSGGDRRNSACIPCSGPDSANILWRIPLDDPPPDRGYYPSGCIVAADGNLRVVHRGALRTLTPSGTVLSKRNLRFRCRYLHDYSLPLALDDGSVWFTSNRRLLCERAARLHLIAHGGLGDDSGVSPNLGYDGAILCGGFDSASRWHNGELTCLDEAGYDIFAPAVFLDGTILLASYYGNGLCRRQPDGALIYKTLNPSREQDGLVTVNDRSEAACRSLNDGHSVVVDLAGKLLWTYDHPATFSCFPGDPGGWIALSDASLARLSPSGRVLWTRELWAGPGPRSARQALVDPRGRIYAPGSSGITAFDAQGKRVFFTDYRPAQCSTLCPIAPGRIALIHDGILYLIGEK